MPAGEFPAAQLTFDYTDALVAYKNADFSAARAALARMQADAKRDLASLDHRKDDEPGEREYIALLVEQMRALLPAKKPDAAATIEALKSMAAKERALPMEFGPPAIYKPTEELLGELYLQTRRPDEARKAFAADLARAPNRVLGTRGLRRAEDALR